MGWRDRSGSARAVRRGDPVIYLANPQLYGEMEIARILNRGKLLCIVDPDSKHPQVEVFHEHEVDVPRATG